MKKTAAVFTLALLWAADILLLTDAVAITLTSNSKLGIFMVWFCALVLLACLVLRKPLLRLTRHGFFRFARAVFLLCWAIFFFAVGFVAVSGYSNTPTGNEQTVIVAGAGLRGEIPSNVLRRRLDATVEYYQKHPDIKIIVTGGMGSGETVPEAVAMKRYLVQKGVPQDIIFTEDKSTSTMQNLTFAADIMKQNGMDEKNGVVLITNAFHCYRITRFAEKAGFTNVKALPASISPVSAPACYFREALAVLHLWVFE